MDREPWFTLRVKNAGMNNANFWSFITLQQAVRLIELGLCRSEWFYRAKTGDYLGVEHSVNDGTTIDPRILIYNHKAAAAPIFSTSLVNLHI